MSADSIPCSSERVNFTRKNLDYLRKERYDAMMDETLNKVGIENVRLEKFCIEVVRNVFLMLRCLARRGSWI